MGRHMVEEAPDLCDCDCGDCEWCPWWMDDPWVKAAGCIVIVALAALGVFVSVMYALGAIS